MNLNRTSCSSERAFALINSRPDRLVSLAARSFQPWEDNSPSPGGEGQGGGESYQTRDEVLTNPHSASCRAVAERRRVRNRRGFTLIEILLAIAIFTLLMAAMYSAWVLVMRATIVGKRTAAQLQRERIAMQTLENSLTFIQSHQASIDYYVFDVENGDSPLLSFVAYLPDDFPRSGEFLNGTPGGPPMDFHVRRVTYSLQADADGEGKDLVLRQNPFLMDMSSAEKNQPLVLAKNVTDFLIECWDTNTSTWATEWDATNIIPPLVRVTLGFANPNSHDSMHPAQVVTRLVSFPSTTMPTSVQTPNNGGNFLGGRGVFNQGNNPGGGQGNGQGGVGGTGGVTPQSSSMQGPLPNLGPPILPTGPPSRAP